MTGKKQRFWAYDVRGCGRCGSNHRKVRAHYFRRGPPGWDAWAMCPRTGDPILLDTGGAPTTDRAPFLPAHPEETNAP